MFRISFSSRSGASRPYHLRASYAFTASRFGPLHNRTFATKASKKASLDTSKTPAVEKLKKLEPTTSVKEALKLAKQKALLSKKIAMAIKSGTSATKVKKQVKKALKAQKERAEAKTLSKIEAPKVNLAAEYIDRMTAPRITTQQQQRPPAVPEKEEKEKEKPKIEVVRVFRQPPPRNAEKIVVKKPILQQKEKLKKYELLRVMPTALIQDLNKDLVERLMPPAAVVLPNVGWKVDSRVKALAQQLNLPIAATLEEAISKKYVWHLVTDDRIKLRHVLYPKEGKKYSNERLANNLEVMRPLVWVDFTRGPTAFRQQTLKLNSPNLRAIKVNDKPISNMHVVDATGGLGIDAFLMASAGAMVTVVERNPLVYTLLYDGWNTARQYPQLRKIMDRMRLVHADSIEYLPTLTDRPDVIYVDTMFPSPDKLKSETKKGMTLSRKLVGTDEQLPELLEIARRVAKYHVVLKRPRYVPVSEGAFKIYKSRTIRWECFTHIEGGSSAL